MSRYHEQIQGNKILDKVVPMTKKQINLRKIMDELTPLLDNELVNANEQANELMETRGSERSLSRLKPLCMRLPYPFK